MKGGTNMKTLSFAFLVLTSLLGACGGDGGSSGTQAATTASAQAPCRESCQRKVRCADPGSPVDLGACTSDCVDEVVGWARQDAVESWASCRNAQACDQTGGDDLCFGGVAPLEIHRQWTASCRAPLATCKNVANDYCDGDDAEKVPLTAPAVMEELIACLDRGTCEVIENCVRYVLSQHGAL